jgi:hypothetical protein
LESAFEKYAKARDIHETEWKVFYNWGNALLEKVNIMMKFNTHKQSHSNNNNNNNEILNPIEESDQIDTDETKRTYSIILDEACTKYEAAFKLNPEAAEV